MHMGIDIKNIKIKENSFVSCEKDIKFPAIGIPL